MDQDIPNPEPLVTSPELPSKPATKQINILLPILVSLVILLLICWVFYYYYNLGRKSTTEQTGTTNQTSNSSEWKTYTNDAVGFSINYPGDSVLSSKNGADGIQNEQTFKSGGLVLIIDFSKTPFSGPCMENTKSAGVFDVCSLSGLGGAKMWNNAGNNAKTISQNGYYLKINAATNNQEEENTLFKMLESFKFN